ncbi:hypothetical protein DFA_02385 [Cavenderia fasciculata]|uniref:FNIP repeat-containing protein n=1 Tax=Cavenderia fasciculata TaxID=261658 RepID=F4PZA9_CACFS|nr:uncharacterized protein DFA_02385 [Cavenderia fasciculata]EGG19138.1 hypothetical protein DFA_02385 [Cavenderia fasciculata]|eukprot:XP_004366771.1 hypothetical protein DFA_02385 [Cavenderia fasciculata]
MSTLLSLSNLLLLYIITDIEDNVDIVCLFLTCKHLLNNSSLKRLIQFKGVGELINIEKREISKQIFATVNRFNLLSFKDILDNSISAHHTIIDSDIENRDTTNSTIVLVKDYQFIPCIYTVPSIETLIINDQREIKDPDEYEDEYSSYYYQKEEEEMVDLGYISQFLPNLQRLDVRSFLLQIGPHSSLKSLHLHVDEFVNLSVLKNKFDSLTELSVKSKFISSDTINLLPSSLTSLTLGPLGIPPRNAFYSLTSLVTLDIDIEFDSHSETPPFIDLSGLINLETFKLSGNDAKRHVDMNFNIMMTVPPSIKNLDIGPACITIPSQCPMPLLERLKVQQSLLIENKGSLSSSPLLKKLVIDLCFQRFPTNLIPSTLKQLTIHKYSGNVNILGKGVFPPTITSLSIKGTGIETIHPNRLPSLIKLKQRIKGSVLPALPQHLKQFTWEASPYRNDKPLLVFPSTNNYPPHLETLNLVDIYDDFTINVPPITKYLLIPLEPNYSEDGIPIYSIGSKIDNTIIQSQQQQQWLPVNTTHLTCRFCKATTGRKVAFRLDEVINHTNVTYLNIWIIKILGLKFEFTIQRLDSDINNNNNSVLVLERQTLQGGIITRQQKTTINSQQHQQYDPIYLYFNIDSTSSPFELNLSYQHPPIL